MVRIGLDDAGARGIAGRRVAKCSARDLAPVAGAPRAPARPPSPPRPHSPFARGSACSPPAGSAASTARRARAGTSRPTSTTLGQTPITVVCAGVKSILDVEATLERLETLNVTLLGYRTDRFPGFYLADSGFPVPWRVDTPAARSPTSRARAPSSALRGDRRRQPDRASSSTRTCTTACCATGSRRPPSEGVRGKDVDAVPARPLPPRDRRREPRGERPARAAQRRAGCADRARHGMTLVVLGDLMVDVVARIAGAARARERHARADRAAPAAARAPTSAAWAGARAAPTSRSSCRVGDDDRAAARAVARAARRRRARRASTPSGRPARCIVLVEPGGERTMLPDPGANDGRELPETARAGDHLHVVGLRAAARRAARERAGGDRARARRRGMTVSVDPSSWALLRRDRRSDRARGRPAAAQRRRGATRSAATCRGARARSVVKLGARRRALERRLATLPGRARSTRSSTPPAPATRSPPGFSAPGRRRRAARGARGRLRVAARAVAQVGARPAYD